jgi:hypothetical protein
LALWTPAAVLETERRDRDRERHERVAAERDEWLVRVGRAGWDAEQTRRRAARLATSRWATPDMKARARRVLDARTPKAGAAA